MPRGVIKRLVADRGFGFIRSDDRGTDVFFHFSVVKGVEFEELKEGQNVSYEVDSGSRSSDKGPRAASVTVE